MKGPGRILPVLVLAVSAAVGRGADWPQYMRVPERTGDAAEEVLTLPLALAAQVRLDDAVTTSPAVVAGKVYVCDQMGTAYCVDPAAGKVLWKASPDGEKAMGGNTSSPCVAGGRMYFGTTAGTFHILDCRDGKVLRTLDLGWPVNGSPVFANGSIYVHTLAATIHCLDPDGNQRWRWDHYRDVSGAPVVKAHPGSYNLPHYGSGAIAVSGKSIVASVGWDLVCLQDKGTSCAQVWMSRAMFGKDSGIPLEMSISSDSVFIAAPGVDGQGCVGRASLADGSYTFTDEKGKQGQTILSRFGAEPQWAVFGTPAVRGSTVFFGRNIRGFAAFEYKDRQWSRKWSAYSWAYVTDWAGTVTSPALSKDHVAYATVDGRLIVIRQDAQGDNLPKLTPKAFIFRTPHARYIASSPAIAGGRVCFGCDDGYLYVLAPEGKRTPTVEKLSLHRPRSQVVSATGRKYAWPYPAANPANTSSVLDPLLQPPLRVRWAIRDFSVFGQTASTGPDDLYYCSNDSTVAAIEQATGRIRWRFRIPTRFHVLGGRAAVTVHDGRLYFLRSLNASGWPVDKRVLASEGALFCVDAADGEVLWTRPVGFKHGRNRTSPVCVGDLVVTATVCGEKQTPTIQAFAAADGREVWKIALDELATARTERPYGWEPETMGPCLLDGTLYFTCGVVDKGGVTMAVEPATGKVLWRNRTYYGMSSFPSGRDGRIYLGGFSAAYRDGRISVYRLAALSAKDGSLVWKSEKAGTLRGAPTIGRDCIILRSYSGVGQVVSLADGAPLIRGGKCVRVGGPTHACGNVRVVLPDLAVGVTVGGLILHDLATGEKLWQSRGFAPRTCAAPCISNGRIFVNPQANGILYCFEPAGPK